MKRSLATYHPLTYKLAVTFRRVERSFELAWDEHSYSKNRSDVPLPIRVRKHQSVLIRKLSSFEDKQLQINKVENLKLVIQAFDGILIQPGETFSFYKLIGKPTRAKGFKEGMELSRGEARVGVAGGICQATNLIYWLALHSPLEIVERHHHSFDPFPDQGRVLPFASGASVMYNYRDLRIRNNTSHVFQLKLWLDKKCLNGDLRCSDFLRYSYKVFDKNHHFEKRGNKVFRRNELWRRVIDKENGGQTVREEFLAANHAEVKYPV